MTNLAWAAHAAKNQKIGVAYELRSPSYDVFELHMQEKPGGSFQLMKVRGKMELLEYMAARVTRGWFKMVADVNSDEAMAWRKQVDDRGWPDA